ncbi:hypothetical protein SAMN05444159_4337 [Bradyrhizobium lablabi]|uniref:Uncharacterized protein n=1 Tax=Bradyrhizobium lablabi TaxID=722472 RepID=A0A1M6VSE9_9BRAD|nr:hypothetical protein [Bradyrhizobium lablabi]SHK84311.1 hypothetical protein SAMN05444159_4337 [Bradyrhizobium lablabi]
MADRKDRAPQCLIVQSVLPLQRRKMCTLCIAHLAQDKPPIIANTSSYAILNNLGSFLPTLESLQSFCGIGRDARA